MCSSGDVNLRFVDPATPFFAPRAVHDQTGDLSFRDFVEVKLRDEWRWIAGDRVYAGVKRRQRARICSD